MKIMNKLAGKISALLLGSAMFATTLGLGIAALPEKGVKATAATTAETIGGVTVQNIEDVIADKSVGINNSIGIRGVNNSAEFTAWNTTKNGSTSSETWKSATIYSAYNRLPEDGDLQNANTVEGNISVANAHTQPIDIFLDGNLTGGNGILSFRTTWDGSRDMVFGIGHTANNTVHHEWSNYTGGGYYIGINPRAVSHGWTNQFMMGKNSTASTRSTDFVTADGTSVSLAAPAGSTTAINAISGAPADGTDVIFTFGAYDTKLADGQTAAKALFFRIKSSDGLTTYVEKTYYDTDYANTYYGTNPEDFFIGFKGSKGSTATALLFKTLTLNGVNQPIFLDNEFTANVTYDFGTTMTDVATAEGWTGFNFAEGATVAVGEKTYEATKTVDYYGNSVTYNYDVTVTGKCDYTTTVSAGYEYGKTLADLTLPEGYAFKTEDLTKELRVGTIELVGTYNGTSAAIITVKITAPVAQKMENVIATDKFSANVALTSGALKIKSVSTGGVMQPSWNNGFAPNADGVNRYSIYNRLPEDGDYFNVNDYDGNISLANTNANPVNLYIGVPNGEGMVSFRTQYDTANGLYLGMGVNSVSTETHQEWSNIKSGYAFVLNQRSANVYTLSKAEGETGSAVRTNAFVNYDGTAVTTTDISNTANARVTGTNIIVTYGMYDSMLEDGTLAKALYLKLYDEDTDTVFFEHTYYDTKYATTVYTNNAADSFLINLKKLANASDVTKAYATTIGGIDQPIYKSVYETKAVASGTAKEGNALSTLTLPTGYAWKNSAAVLAEGENSCEATYTGMYYGKAFSFDVTVSVTAEGLPKSKVTFLDANGGVISSVSGKAGQQVTFADGSANTTKTFIGWKDESGKLYPAGYVLTAPEVAVDVTYTLVEIGFALEDGAAVRLIKANENGKEYGGLRFTVKLDDSTYVTALKAAIVPYDAGYYTDGAFTAAAISLAYALTDEHVYQTVDGTDYYGFTLTDIIYSNYNRAFAGMAFVTVTYQDGTTKDIFTAFNAEQNVRSVQQVATSLYAKHLAAIGSVENPYGLYGENALGILESYINGVVDLVYADGTFAVTTTEDGLADVAPTYALVENGTTVEGDTVTIQVQINVSQTLYEEGQTPNIPVTVRVKGSGGYTVVRIVKPTIVSYVDGVATISFKLSDLNV